jgi:hypothetical protein
MEKELTRPLEKKKKKGNEFIVVFTVNIMYFVLVEDKLL